MTSYRTGQYRKDRSLTVFSATDARDGAKLLGAICSNVVTGYVRQTPSGGVLVPAGTTERIAAHLAECGWTVAGIGGP